MVRLECPHKGHHKIQIFDWRLEVTNQLAEDGYEVLSWELEKRPGMKSFAISSSLTGILLIKMSKEDEFRYRMCNNVV